MTQKNKKYINNVYFPKAQEPDKFLPLDIRILVGGAENLLQTSTHLVETSTQSGKKMYKRVECAKKSSYGDIRNTIPCALCATETYPTTKKYWAYVIDNSMGANGVPKNELGYMEMPYSLVQAISAFVDTFTPIQPWYNFKFRVTRTVTKGTDSQGRPTSKTTYNSMSIQAPEPFDLLTILNEYDLQNFPPIVDIPKNFPPIMSVTQEEMAGMAQGKMPWDNGGGGGAEDTAYVPMSVPGVAPVQAAQPAYAPAQQAPAQQAPTSYQPAPVAYAQPAAQPAPVQPAPVQQAYAQPAVQPVAQQPVYEQPAQQAQQPVYTQPSQVQAMSQPAYVVGAQGDALPASFSAVPADTPAAPTGGEPLSIDSPAKFF